MTEDGSGPGGTVEAEIWELFDADDAVTDDIVFLVAAALTSDDDLAEQLGGSGGVGGTGGNGGNGGNGINYISARVPPGDFLPR